MSSPFVPRQVISLPDSSQAQRECICYNAPLMLPIAPPASILAPHPPLMAPSGAAFHEQECAICLDPLVSLAAVKLIDCQHTFHHSCIIDSLSHDPRCPVCRKNIGEPRGFCPSGSMSTSTKKQTCPGFRTKTIQIDYVIPGGVQLPYHGNPGRHYGGTSRTAYLPDNKAGRELLARLKYAWMHGLVFTVGTSLTTGRSNVVVWSSIHHKTSLSGGPHGFPDPNYLANCNGSLDALNVPSADDCAPYNNALKRVHQETLKYTAPVAMGIAFQDALQPVQSNPSLQILQPPQPSAPPPPTNPEIARPKEMCPQGHCPSGIMMIQFTKQHCPGYGCTSIEIVYYISAGTQMSYHPNPGVGYPGTTRIAYLPDNDEGRELLCRLKCAWKCGLIFKIGASLTSKKSNVIVWGSIPHKTSLLAGEFGFPDTNYIARCHAKLDALNVPNANLCL